MLATPSIYIVGEASRRARIGAWLRREGLAGAEAVPHTILTHWPMLLGMAALAAGGLLFAPGPIGEAVAFAAVAAAVIDVVAGVSSRVRSAGDRELAGATVGGAATVVLDSPIQFTEGAGPISEQVPDISLRAIGNGGLLFVKLHDPASALGRIRGRLFDNRQLYAATAGTQVALLGELERRVAVDAQRELDAAIIALDRLRDKHWRHGVLKSAGAKAKPLDAYRAADLGPQSERFHALARSAAALLAWLERRRGRAPRRHELEFDAHAPDRESAARALVAQAIDNVIDDIGPLSNWVKDSSLAAVQVRSLDDVAAVDELVFSGQAIGNGWESLHTVAVQGARELGEIVDMVEPDLAEPDLGVARRLHEQLLAIGKAAFAAGEGERAATDARVKNLAPDQLQGADDVLTTRRRVFRDLLREWLREARALLARRPSGF